MEKITKYELTSTERTTFRVVADAVWNICKLYDDECHKMEDTAVNVIDTNENKSECPFSCFCPYFCDKEKEIFSDVVRSVPIMLEDIELNVSY
jgi:hypothetical protein